MFHLIWYILVGLIAGVIAKSVMHVHMTIFWTISQRQGHSGGNPPLGGSITCLPRRSLPRRGSRRQGTPRKRRREPNEDGIEWDFASQSVNGKSSENWDNYFLMPEIKRSS